jgi:hypothetical protein
VQITLVREKSIFLKIKGKTTKRLSFVKRTKEEQNLLKYNTISQKMK